MTGDEAVAVARENGAKTIGISGERLRRMKTGLAATRTGEPHARNEENRWR